MFHANYPVIGIQECYPVYLTGIGISDPEFHTHREEGLISHQILFTMSGKGKIIVGDKEYTAGKGSIFYIASGESHTYYPIDGDWTTYWVVFRGDSLDAMMARLGFGRYVVKTINDITEVKKLYDQIAAAAREPGDGAGHCSMLVYQYILLMHKLLIVQQENRTGTVVDNAIVFMEKNYRDDISLQTLASVCGISTQHFCRVFHDKIGMRPMEYLARKRVGSAKVALLDTNAPIAQIGRRVGYKDANYFGIVFKKYEGISPREYRNSHNHIG